jgi:hypothetical protein
VPTQFNGLAFAKNIADIFSHRDAHMRLVPTLVLVSSGVFAGVLPPIAVQPRQSVNQKQVEHHGIVADLLSPNFYVYSRKAILRIGGPMFVSAVFTGGSLPKRQKLVGGVSGCGGIEIARTALEDMQVLDDMLARAKSAERAA